MKLIDLLVRELTKRGGWPEGAECAVQDADSQLCFSSHVDVVINSGKTDWLDGQWSGGWSNPYLDELSDDHSTAIVTRAQYESALAASQNGEWNGESLPSIGCEVEFIPGMLSPASSDDNKPFQPTTVKVVAHEKYPMGGNDVFVGVWIAESGGMRSSVFSPRCCVPIRTEAERKRDDAKKAISELRDRDGYKLAACIIDPIYDAIAAGKIPGVKLED